MGVVFLGLLFAAMIAIPVGVALFGKRGRAAFARRRVWKRCERLMKGAPESTVAAAPGGGRVTINGRIVGLDGTFVETVLDRGDAVWRLSWVANGPAHDDPKLWSEEECVPFLVDDGSGQLARVEPAGALVRTPLGAASRHRVRPLLSRVEAFLARRGKQYLARRRYFEETLSVGDPILVTGVLRQEPGSPTTEGYRASPTTELVVRSGATPETQLLLWSGGKDELLRERAANSTAPLVVLIVSGLLYAVYRFVLAP